LTNSLPVALRAASLLGRWTLVAERHGNGCSCCPPGIDVPMETVEQSVTDYLKVKHPALTQSVTGLLRDCVRRQAALDEAAAAPLFDDLSRAIDDLERMQLGLA
jgi:hypothetical protein